MRRLFELVIVLLISHIVFSCSVSSGVRPPPVEPPPDIPVLVGQLQSIGQILLWSGAGILALGVGIRIAGILGILGPIAIVSRLVPFLPGIGIANLALGCAMVWLSDNLWVLGVSFALTALALGFHYRRHIRRWLVAGQEPRSKRCLDSKG
jgi:hypothetical protein